MKVIFTALQYNHYDSTKGASFEYETFRKALSHYEGVELIYVPYDDIKYTSRAEWNKKIITLVEKEKPDALFAFMYTDEFFVETLKELKKHTKTIAWFPDDHWRLYNYSLRYAPHFSWVITTWSKAVAIYKKHGVINVIRSQWATNTNEENSPLDKTIPVSFVGLWSAPRQQMIKKIQNAGIPVTVYGRGWQNGSLSEQEMKTVILKSRITLALNPAPGRYTIQSLSRIILKPMPPEKGKYSLTSIAKLFFKRDFLRLIVILPSIGSLRAWIMQSIRQIKARHFELPLLGTCTITLTADDLQNYFIPNKEMVIVNNTTEMIEKIKYYLSHTAEAENIAQAGRARVLKDHDYQQRFRDIFKRIGLE
jgi:spore maturation protein CgeB